jgi:transcriptional antiterminator RfaH
MKIAHDWYVIQTKPREDQRALDNLRAQSFEAFQPRCTVTRKRAGQRREVLEPLFPGYVFVALDRLEQDWGPIRSTRGVARLVRFGDEIPSLPTGLVESLRALDGIVLADPVARLKRGDAVRIVDGPLAGMQAAFDMVDGEQRAFVLLEWMQRRVRVAVARTALEAVA